MTTTVSANTYQSPLDPETQASSVSQSGAPLFRSLKDGQYYVQLAVTDPLAREPKARLCMAQLEKKGESIQLSIPELHTKPVAVAADGAFRLDGEVQANMPSGRIMVHDGLLEISGCWRRRVDADVRSDGSVLYRGGDFVSVLKGSASARLAETLAQAKRYDTPRGDVYVARDPADQRLFIVSRREFGDVPIYFPSADGAAASHVLEYGQTGQWGVTAVVASRHGASVLQLVYSGHEDHPRSDRRYRAGVRECVPSFPIELPASK